MNRTEHLLRQAREVSMLRGHIEHIILDFGSTTPISPNHLPSDERIKLHRVESPNRRWWLTHSYNLAFALASGEYILKLDADILPSQDFMDELWRQQQETKSHMLCNRLTSQDWCLPSSLFTTNGLFLCKRTSLAEIQGFNPYIQGWGWDEIDLYSRFFLAGFPVARFNSKGLRIIDHSNEMRETNACLKTPFIAGLSKKRLIRIEANSRLKTQDEKNKQIAIESLVKSLTWPSLDQYRDAFLAQGSLPHLPVIELFDERREKEIQVQLIWRLLKPSKIERLFWILLAWLRIGPYSHRGAKRLLWYSRIEFSRFVPYSDRFSV